jgi:hypothetical protein
VKQDIDEKKLWLFGHLLSCEIDKDEFSCPFKALQNKSKNDLWNDVNALI